ncbi:MAG TPA: hypothetical protein VMW50_11485 [Dehalococcoidia bacterium]|nr:hypothetical protein [Dehalococcoidia bacterium]
MNIDIHNIDEITINERRIVDEQGVLFIKEIKIVRGTDISRINLFTGKKEIKMKIKQTES